MGIQKTALSSGEENFRNEKSYGWGTGTEMKSYDDFFKCPKCGSQAITVHPDDKGKIVGEAL